MTLGRAPDEPSCSEDTSPESAVMKQQLEKASGLKQEGNELFKKGEWTEALVAYRTALGHVPPKTPPLDEPVNGDPSADDNTRTGSRRDEIPDDAPPSPSPPPPKPPISESEAECAKARAVLHANIAACLVKLDDNKGVIDACTQALEDDPHYVKALQRRAAAGEKTDSWSSLARAEEDYKLLLELLPQKSAEAFKVERALRAVEPRKQAAQQRETAEMMDKLKGLGNNILGRFGLSTDNFKFEPNGNGGYSMNFVR